MHSIDFDHLPMLDSPMLNGPRLDGIMHRRLTDPRGGTEGLMLIGGVEAHGPPHPGAELRTGLALVTPKVAGKPPKTPKSHDSPHPKAAAYA